MGQYSLAAPVGQYSLAAPLGHHRLVLRPQWASAGTRRRGAEMLRRADMRRTRRCGHYARVCEEKMAALQVAGCAVNAARMGGAQQQQQQLVWAMEAEEFSVRWLEREDRPFSARPVVFCARDSARALGIGLPEETMEDARELLNYLPAERPVRLLDVGTQTEMDERVPLGQFLHYFMNRSREKHRVLNLISMEFSSDTALAVRVRGPQVVRTVDWDGIWSEERRAFNDYPAVQHYCLISVAECVTDWHLDFGGTSVWYHIVQGAKVFFFAPPTEFNLQAFARWSNSPQQRAAWLGDQLAGVFYVRIEKGQTLLVPPGWLHAVYTPQDSFVFGGNFLHSYGIRAQLQVNALERYVLRVPHACRYPMFRQMMIYAAANLLKRIRTNTTSSNASSETHWSRPELSFAETCDLPYLARALELWFRKALSSSAVSATSPESKGASAGAGAMTSPTGHDVETQCLATVSAECQLTGPIEFLQELRDRAHAYTATAAQVMEHTDEMSLLFFDPQTMERAGEKQHSEDTAPRELQQAGTQIDAAPQSQNVAARPLVLKLSAAGITTERTPNASRNEAATTATAAATAAAPAAVAATTETAGVKLKLKLPSAAVHPRASRRQHGHNTRGRVLNPAVLATLLGDDDEGEEEEQEQDQEQECGREGKQHWAPQTAPAVLKLRIPIAAATAAATISSSGKSSAADVDADAPADHTTTNGHGSRKRQRDGTQATHAAQSKPVKRQRQKNSYRKMLSRKFGWRR